MFQLHTVYTQCPIVLLSIEVKAFFLFLIKHSFFQFSNPWPQLAIVAANDSFVETKRIDSDKLKSFQ